MQSIAMGCCSMQNKRDPQNLVSDAVQSLSSLLTQRITSADNKLQKTAVTLAYWIKDYVRFLNREMTAPSTYRRYDRGCVVSVHLGFRIGHEEGGLHYAIVIDKYDTSKNSVLTVLPLTSLKDNVDPNHLYFKNLFIGSEITDAIYNKINRSFDSLTVELNQLINELEQLENAPERDMLKICEYKKRLKLVDANRLLASKQLDKLAKMKSGSIVLVDQIVTVSKLRIYDPCSSKDMLYGIKIGNETMNKIDEKIKQLYIY